MEPASLYRLNETQWSFKKGEKEIRLSTPGFANRADDYQLAEKIQEFIRSLPSLDSWIAWEYPSLKKGGNPDLQGRWQIREVTAEEFRKFQDGSIIYKRDFADPGVRIFSIEPMSRLRALSLALQRLFPFLQGLPESTKKMALPFDARNPTAMFFQGGSFQDPFTRLSERALQRYESPFISEHKTRGSYHFTLEDGILSLRHNSRLNHSQGTNEAVTAFRDYLRKSFEWRTLRTTPEGFEADLRAYPETFDLQRPRSREDQFLGYLKETYGIDFEEMLKEKRPLLPDHVYKCNIAACQAEMAYLESFYGRLENRLKGNLQGNDAIALPSSKALNEYLERQGAGRFFSLKEIEGIYRSFSNSGEAGNLGGLRRYLASFASIPSAPENALGKEPFAKLPAPEKSMILRPFASGSLAARALATRPTPGGLVEERGRKGPEKGDFAGSGSFAIGSKAIHYLNPQSLHRLMEILSPPFSPKSGVPETFFTGRKIVHFAISGYKTLGDKGEYDPCRNSSELLHVFPDLRKGPSLNHSELLAHVVAKKALHQCYPARGSQSESEWRVGRMIPFFDEGAVARWYYVDGYLNDGKGDVNYILIPASRGYLDAKGSRVAADIRFEKRAPLVKLYRSTASDPEAESSIESILADLNPKQVGSLDFNRGDQYERPYFQKCTMPVWAGYLAAGKAELAAVAFLESLSQKNRKDLSANGKEENLLQLLEWQGRMTKKQAEAVYQSFKKRVGPEALRAFFTETAAGAEWAKSNKIAQDVYFIGHSLGGALSQNAFYHFGPKEGRIPLAGCRFKCFAFDPPGGVGRTENEDFLQFGRKHRELFKALGQTWEILYQCEYQDFIPQGGAAWLGISKETHTDADWLDITGVLFKPLSSAQSKEITTLPTHGRRFRHLTPEEAKTEYEALPLSVQELHAFKDAYWLPLELRLKFGFFVTTPRLSEAIRQRIGGTFIFYMIWLKKQWDDLWRREDKRQDASGVTFFQMKTSEYGEERHGV